MYTGKIFCIGFQKTGTSSIGKALEILGYRTCGAVALQEQDPTKIRTTAFANVDKFDAFQDNPWPLLYLELDQRFPGSKFILTRRDPQSWIKSVVRHFGNTGRPMLKWIYGVPYPKGNEEVFLERYDKHNQDVLEYFSQRPGDLLVLDIETDNQWPHIAKFLNTDVPTVAFPHANKSAAPWRFRRWLRRLGARALRRLD